MKINIKKFKQVKSTNDVAIKLIKRNIQGPTLITSEKQKKGRGQVGKKWISKKGNLFFSIFFKLDQKKINFRQFALLFNKQKFCGILQEVVKFKHFDYLIVGIGLNTNIAPQNKSFKSTCLKNILNKSISNQKILKDIKSAYEKFLLEKNRLSFSNLKRKYK